MPDKKRRIFVGFSSPRKKMIGAELIKWWTKSTFSHVYFRFESSNPKIPSTVYHAANGMVHFRTEKSFLKNNVKITELDILCTDDEYIDILAHCMKLSGEKYGYADLLKILICDIWYWATSKELKLKNGKGYICSELVGVILTKIMNIEFGKPTYLLKPTDVFDGTVLLASNNRP